MSQDPIAPVEGFEYYKNSIYWNNFDKISENINTAISGDKGTDWVRHLKNKYGKFNEALFPNCGNGWVERDMFRAGAINNVIGTDISEDLLNQARDEAKDNSMPAHYFVEDANNFSNDYKVDIIINYAAMHHVAKINQLTQTFASSLNPNGIYVCYDYVGAHRNQYDIAAWTRCVEVRNKLPEKYRSKLYYPHISTMLATDPSEAIHSELQMDTLHRYFDIVQETKFGGGVSYSLLYENNALHVDQHTDEGEKWIDMIIAEDEKLLDQHEQSNMFSFIIAKPKTNQPSQNERNYWQELEDNREYNARNNGGMYYPLTPLALIYNNFYGEIDALKSKISSLESKLL